MASESNPSSAAKAAKPSASMISDPALYLYTSLTAGSSHIVTATSRLETILRANRVPFKAVDLATNDKARRLWGRRAGKDESGRVRKLPGIVQDGMVLGDLVEIEEWNEYGELKQHVVIYYDESTQPPIGQALNGPSSIKKPALPKATATKSSPAASPLPGPCAEKNKENKPASCVKPAAQDTAVKATALPVRTVAEEAAQMAKQLKLQSLREKVHDNMGHAKEEKDVSGEKQKAGQAAGGEKATEKNSKTGSLSTTQESIPAGLQSPTSGAWRVSEKEQSLVADSMQSPTTARWKSVDIEVAAASETTVERGEKAKERNEDDEEEEDEESAKREDDYDKDEEKQAKDAKDKA